jgi:hypothetical protein
LSPRDDVRVRKGQRNDGLFCSACAQGVASVVLLSLVSQGTSKGPGDGVELEQNAGPSAAQAELWAFERRLHIKDPDAYTAAANASIEALKQHKAAAPGAILHERAAASEEKYYEMEIKKGRKYNAASAPNQRSPLSPIATNSKNAYYRWQIMKGIYDPNNPYELEEDSPKTDSSWDAAESRSIVGYLQNAKIAAKEAVQVTEGGLPNRLSEENKIAMDDAHAAAEKKVEKQEEDKVVAKEEDARKMASKREHEWETAHGVHDDPNPLEPKQVTSAGKDEDANKKIVKVAGHAASSPATKVKKDDETAIVDSHTSANAVPSHPGDGDPAKAQAAPSNPGLDCLKQEGLNDKGLEDFSASAVCVGWKIKMGMGLGDTVHMVKDYLQAPMNRQKIMPCLDKLDQKSRTIIKTCLGRLPSKQAANNPVVEFWKTAVE